MSVGRRFVININIIDFHCDFQFQINAGPGQKRAEKTRPRNAPHSKVKLPGISSSFGARGHSNLEDSHVSPVYQTRHSYTIYICIYTYIYYTYIVYAFDRSRVEGECWNRLGRVLWEYGWKKIWGLLYGKLRLVFQCTLNMLTKPIMIKPLNRTSSTIAASNRKKKERHITLNQGSSSAQIQTTQTKRTSLRGHVGVVTVVFVVAVFVVAALFVDFFSSAHQRVLRWYPSTAAVVVYGTINNVECDPEPFSIGILCK